jgi:hypothetical protein
MQDIDIDIEGEEKAEELYKAYSDLRIQAENTSYLSKLLAANWTKRANESNNKHKQEMLERTQMLHNLSSAAGQKAEEAMEKAQKLRVEHDFHYSKVSSLLYCLTFNGDIFLSINLITNCLKVYVSSTNGINISLSLSEDTMYILFDL